MEITPKDDEKTTNPSGNAKIPEDCTDVGYPITRVRVTHSRHPATAWIVARLVVSRERGLVFHVAIYTDENDAEGVELLSVYVDNHEYVVTLAVIAEKWAQVVDEAFRSSTQTVSLVMQAWSERAAAASDDDGDHQLSFWLAPA